MDQSTRYRPVIAYNNEAFLESREARPLRILSEYIEPQARFEKFKVRDTIVFLGSARLISREQAEGELERARDEGGDIKTAETKLAMSRYYEDTRELARRLTEWSKSLTGGDRRFVVCTGGGPGVMEAANRGASEAKGLNLGFNIAIPVEQVDNPYVTRQLTFEFHYFFMRKFWFAYLAKAIVVMPGGFGTLDELFEILTLLQTEKVNKRLPVVLYGTDYWDKIINLEGFADAGTISREDLDLIHRTNSVDDAYTYIVEELTQHSLGRPGAIL